MKQFRNMQRWLGKVLLATAMMLLIVACFAACGEGEVEHVHYFDEAHTHVTAPTCDEAGYTEKTCVDCNEVVKTDIIPALGHSYTAEKIEGVDYREVVAPTCTAEGYTQYNCMRCSESYKTAFTDKLDHNLNKSKGQVVEPTCTEQGYTLYPCRKCEQMIAADFVPAAHKPTASSAKVTAPTCGHEGYTTYTCELCSQSFQADQTPALTHTPKVGGEVITPPTCDSEGYTTYICDLCVQPYQGSVVEALKHVAKEGSAVVTDPTCDAPGYTTYTCELCSHDFTADETDQLVHVPAINTAIVTPPSCIEGYTSYLCVLCGDRYVDETTKTAPVSGHTCDGNAVVTAPSCVQGYTTHTCAVCHALYDDTYTEITSAHTFSGDTCTVCGAKKTYTRVDANGTESATGEYVLFGSYPQSQISDAELVKLLNVKAGALPTASLKQAWTAYGYYTIGSNVTSFMWYQDLAHEGEIYRGVYFATYRPYVTTGKTNSYQDDNGYQTNTTYWFKYEPMKWKIVTEANGVATLVSEVLLDSSEYRANYLFENGKYYAIDRSGKMIVDANGEPVLANDYENSTIRTWLNDNTWDVTDTENRRNDSNSFFKTAFGDITGYVAADMLATFYTNDEDAVFLLSIDEVITWLGNNASKALTDYAMCQGGYEVKNSKIDNCGYWWLRSTGSEVSGEMADRVCADSSLYGGYVNNTSYGVCPAIRIQL